MAQLQSGTLTAAPRADGRWPGQLRPLRFQNDIAPHATGSTLIEWGNTRVICGVTVEETERDGIHPIFVALINQAKCFRIAALACFDGPVIDDVFAHQQSTFRRPGPPVSSIFGN